MGLLLDPWAAQERPESPQGSLRPPPGTFFLTFWGAILGHFRVPKSVRFRGLVFGIVRGRFGFMLAPIWEPKTYVLLCGGRAVYKMSKSMNSTTLARILMIFQNGKRKKMFDFR